MIECIHRFRAAQRQPFDVPLSSASPPIPLPNPATAPYQLRDFRNKSSIRISKRQGNLPGFCEDLYTAILLVRSIESAHFAVHITCARGGVAASGKFSRYGDGDGIGSEEEDAESEDDSIDVDEHGYSNNVSCCVS